MAQLKLGTLIGGNLAWHAGNDGFGSGLDADLLDGNHGSYFLDTSSSTQIKSGSLSLGGDITVSGNLTVIGTTTTTSTSNNSYINNFLDLRKPVKGWISSDATDVGIKYNYYNPTGHRNIITSGSGNGTTVTLTVTGAPYPVGGFVNIVGVVPSGFNGVFKVTASDSTSVSFLSSQTGSVTTTGALGTIVRLTEFASSSGSSAAHTATIKYTFPALALTAGDVITLAGFIPTAYNGDYTILTAGVGTFTISTAAPNIGAVTQNGSIIVSNRFAFGGFAADTGAFEFYQVGAIAGSQFHGIYGTIKTGAFWAEPTGGIFDTELTDGFMLKLPNATSFNFSTATSGTLAQVKVAAIGQQTLGAINTGLTYTNAASLYIAGAPIAGTNVTITNPYSLQVATGNSYFGGQIISGVTLGTAPIVVGSTTVVTNLNADLLDGQHGTYYYPASNPSGYQPGTVTSVGGTGTVSGLSLSGTVTTTGNLTLSGTLAVTAANFSSQSANNFLAAPNGSAGAPTFRTIIAADIPTLNQNTTGTASNVTGTVAILNGGTGATSAAGALTSLGAQATLVSGTNIKTINGTTLLGSGDLVVITPAAGANTQLQFNNSGALGASANLTFNGTTLTINGHLSAEGVTSTGATGTGSLVFSASPTITGTLGSLDAILFSGTNVVSAVGKMWFDNTTGSLNFAHNNIIQQIGEEQFIYGQASSNITDGQVIVVTGAVGIAGFVRFAPAQANLADPGTIIGLSTETIAANSYGRITTFGIVHNLNTTGTPVGETWSNGDTLYYSPAGSGKLTNIKPAAPNQKTIIGTVIYVDALNGSIQVDIARGSQLGGTDSNVELTSPADKNLLQYDGTAGYWKNVTAASVSVGNVTGTVAIANGGTGQTTALAGFNALSPMTAAGDLIVGGTTGSALRLGIGGANTVLHGGSTTPTYSAVVEADISLSANATNNVNTARHGFVPVLPNNANLFFNGQGNYTTPSGLSISSSYSATAFSGQTSINIIHNFGTFPIVQVVDLSGAVLIPLSIINNSVNDFTVAFSSAQTGTIMASVGSPQPQSVTVVAASTYTVLPADRIVKVTTANAVITLPTSVGNTGREYNIVNASTSIITVKCFGSQTINTQLTQTLPSYSAMTVFADGSGFWII